MPERDKNGRFLPGHKGTGGRKPLMPADFRTLAQQAAPDALERLIALIQSPATDAAQVVSACRLIIERAYGRPGLEEGQDLTGTLARLDQLIEGISHEAER